MAALDGLPFDIFAYRDICHVLAQFDALSVMQI